VGTTNISLLMIPQNLNEDPRDAHFDRDRSPGITGGSVKILELFQNLGTSVTNQNCVHDGIKEE